MTDVRGLLEGEAAGFQPRPDLEGVLQRLGRRHRRRRVTSAVVSLAVFAGAASGLWIAVQTDESTPRPPSTVHPPRLLTDQARRIELPAQARDVSARTGGVWVIVDEELLRLDPESGEVVASVTVPGSGGRHGTARAVAATEDRIWVSDAETQTLSLIDPETSRVMATADTSGLGDEALPLEIAADGEEAWVTVPVRDGAILARADEETGQFTLRVPLGGDLGRLRSPFWRLSAPALDQGTVWVVRAPLEGHPLESDNPDRALLRIDSPSPVEGRVVDELLSGEWLTTVEVGFGSVWVGSDDEVVRLDPATGEELARIAVPGRAIEIVAGEGGVWVDASGLDTGDDELVVIDPDSNEVIGDPYVMPRLSVLKDVAGGAVWIVHHQPRLTRIPVTCGDAPCASPSSEESTPEPSEAPVPGS